MLQNLTECWEFYYYFIFLQKRLLWHPTAPELQLCRDCICINAHIISLEEGATLVRNFDKTDKMVLNYCLVGHS